jgi:hypothetical protein
MGPVGIEEVPAIRRNLHASRLATARAESRLQSSAVMPASVHDYWTHHPLQPLDAVITLSGHTAELRVDATDEELYKRR